MLIVCHWSVWAGSKITQEMVLALESEMFGKPDSTSYPWNERPIIGSHTNKIRAYFYLLLVNCNSLFFHNWLSLLIVLPYVCQCVTEPSLLTTVRAATANKCSIATVGQILTQTQST